MTSQKLVTTAPWHSCLQRHAHAAVNSDDASIASPEHNLNPVIPRNVKQ